MDHLFEFLFKYRWSTFARGELGLANRPPWWALLLLGIAGVGLLLYLYWLYWRPLQAVGRGGGAGIEGSSRWLLMALRGALLLVLAVMLMRPVLVLPSIIPRSTNLLLLIDESLSMGLSESGGAEGKESRLEAVKRTWREGQAVRLGLEQKFKVRPYGFSTTVRPLTSTEELQATGRGTDLVGALQEGVREMAGSPLSAIVLVSDGGNNTARDLAEELRRLRGRQLPIFTVGVGSTERGEDQELVRVTVPRRVLAGSAISAEVVVQLSSPKIQKLTVKEEERVIHQQPLPVSDGRGEPQRITVEFSPTSPGHHRYRFEISPIEGEISTENNLQEALIEIVDEAPRLLYLEGEPRWEYGKVRASLGRAEKQLQLVSVLRSAEGKYYRQGVTSGEELSEGFPKSEEELFGYAGLILGSLEANFFRYEQLRWIEQFVERRGGGVLLLGGSRAFGAGGYAGTPIGDLSPLSLRGVAAGGAKGAPMGFRPRVTAEGRYHPVTRLNEDRALSAETWETLPPITIPELLEEPKPAAKTILAAVATADVSRAVPLLIEQRYGRGRSMALLANDTWRWRMELPSENLAHETFWRQLLRYLISTSPRPLEIGPEEMVSAVGDQVRLRAEIRSARYEPITDAVVRAVITSPSGSARELSLTLDDTERTSTYLATILVTEPGVHKIDMTAQKGGSQLGQAQGVLLATEQTREYFEATQNVELLKRIARETGGKYTPLSDADDLPEEVSMLEGAYSERVRRDLWDMPFNFLLLIGLVATEWGLRKRLGLA
jgi:uncharacterized membrane protein